MENVCMANFYNQATLAYNGKTVNSNITTGEIMERVTVTKTAVLDRYYADSEITYVITIRYWNRYGHWRRSAVLPKAAYCGL